MNIHTLEEFLYSNTAGEKWHLANPNLLSPFYDELVLQSYEGTSCYCFDFARTLKSDKIGVIKESRFTTIPTHYHKDMELNYIYNGSCTFLINGKEVTLQKGEICILDANVLHCATSIKTEHDIVINIVFKKEFFNSVFLSRLSKKGILTNFLLDAISENRKHDRYLIFNSLDNSKIFSLIQFLLCEYFGPGKCFEELTQTYVTAIFLELINSLYEHQVILNSSQGQKQESIIAMLHYIEKNYNHCTLEDLANTFNYNPTYVSSLLKRKTGKSFIELKTMQQISEASFLLLNTDKTINDIIHKIGCQNIHYFYQKFHHKYGLTPKQYRSSNARYDLY